MITSESLKNEKKLVYIFNRGNIVHTTVKKSKFSFSNLTQDWERLSSSPSTPLLDIAHDCLAALICYLDLCSDASNHGSYSVYKYDLTQYVKLDATAMTALNLFPMDTTSGKNFSLFGVLNVHFAYQLTHIGMQDESGFANAGQMD